MRTDLRSLLLLTPAWLLLLAFSSQLGTARAADPPAYETEWGSPGTGNGEFDGPQGLAVAEFGEIYVADTGNHRIQRFDLDGVYLDQWGSLGAGDGEFRTPFDVAVDDRGNVYVADTLNDRIQKFDANGSFLTKWGSHGTGDGQFEAPTGIAVDYWSGVVFVVDQWNNRIQRFDADGTYLGQWGQTGSGAGDFYLPTSVAVGLDGTVFVADTENHRVQAFDPTGGFLHQWGTPGAGPSEFDLPAGIGIDCEGNVYVGDTGNHRVQKFDPAGNLLVAWGMPGTGPSQFDGPTGFAALVSHAIPVGSKRALTTPLYVVDTGNHRIQRFTGPCCASFLCDNSTATVEVPATALISPAGNGPTLAARGATVTVQIRDCCDQGVAGYPFQDIWLGDVGNGDLVFCQGGSVADANTDADGFTTISGALSGGGWTEAGTRVYLAGVPIGAVPLPLSVNSPDQNGDLVVDLVDLGAFATDFNEPAYDFRSDFTADGVENLADVGVFAFHYLDDCP